jgi:hypothetical protein
MEAIEQGHGGPEVLFANRKNDAAEPHRMADALAATAAWNRRSVRQGTSAYVPIGRAWWRSSGDVLCARSVCDVEADRQFWRATYGCG